MDRDDRIREAAMAWLDQRVGPGHEQVTMEEMAEFTFEGERVRLIDRGRGIRHPSWMRAALSIMTRYTSPGEMPRYLDQRGPDGLLRYKYRDDEKGSAENRFLMRAHDERCKLIWFVGSAPHRYVPIYPVWIVGNEPAQSQFVVALDTMQLFVKPGDESQREYVERLTRQRLHQPVFRAQVMAAYDHSCAMCRLRYPSLLDAAHILSDSHPDGKPVVSNGLSLCKIHHAAYDRNILGVRPDLVIEVRRDVIDDTDGPMLLHGLQEMAGGRLSVPGPQPLRPDPRRLEERYEAFRKAG